MCVRQMMSTIKEALPLFINVIFKELFRVYYSIRIIIISYIINMYYYSLEIQFGIQAFLFTV